MSDASHYPVQLSYAVYDPFAHINDLQKLIIDIQFTNTSYRAQIKELQEQIMLLNKQSEVIGPGDNIKTQLNEFAIQLNNIHEDVKLYSNKALVRKLTRENETLKQSIEHLTITNNSINEINQQKEDLKNTIERLTQTNLSLLTSNSKLSITSDNARIQMSQMKEKHTNQMNAIIAQHDLNHVKCNEYQKEYEAKLDSLRKENKALNQKLSKLTTSTSNEVTTTNTTVVSSSETVNEIHNLKQKIKSLETQLQQKTKCLEEETLLYEQSTSNMRLDYEILIRDKNDLLDHNNKLIQNGDQTIDKLQTEILNLRKQMDINSNHFHDQMNTLYMLAPSTKTLDDVFQYIPKYNTENNFNNSNVKCKVDPKVIDEIFISWKACDQMDLYQISDRDIKLAFIKMIAHIKSIYNSLQQLESNSNQPMDIDEVILETKEKIEKTEQKEKEQELELEQDLEQDLEEEKETTVITSKKIKMEPTHTIKTVLYYQRMCRDLKAFQIKQLYFFQKWIQQNKQDSDDPQYMNLFLDMLKLDNNSTVIITV